MRNNFSELVLPVVLIAVLVSLVWPVARDHAMVMAQQGVLLAGFIAFALWLWREGGADEREDLHRMLIGRAAYLVGSGVLLAGIVVQSVAGSVDRWLVFALIGMVLTKVAGSIWARLNY